MAFFDPDSLSATIASTAAAPAPAAAAGVGDTVLGLQGKLNRSTVLSHLTVKRFEGVWEYMLPIHPTTGAPVPNVGGAPAFENRVCAQPRSKLHRLTCMHYVWTAVPEQCAPNCLSVKDKMATPSNAAPPSFLCRLCARLARSNDPSLQQDPSAWTELLLEKHTDGDDPSLLYGTRDSSIVFLARDGTIIPILTKLDAAITRILWKKEDDAGKKIRLNTFPGLFTQRAAAGSSLQSPSGIDATGFNFDIVPKGPKNFGSAPPTDAPRAPKALLNEAPRGLNGEWSIAQRRKIAAIERRDAADEARVTRTREPAQALDAMDLQLDYGDAPARKAFKEREIVGSAGGVLSSREKKNRRQNKTQRRAENERKRKEAEDKKKLEDAEASLDRMTLE